MSSTPTSYFSVQGKIKPIMEALQKAGVPDKFTLSFLNSLGFKSTNARPILAVLKSLGFLNQSGIPTQSYRDYKDTTKAKGILAKRMEEAYSDVFLANEKANTLGVEKLKGTFASLTGKSDSVATKMAGTFKALCSLADFSKPKTEKKESVDVAEKETSAPKIDEVKKSGLHSSEFHYNIQIHLPNTRDISVYNAIFKSLKDHLL